jgi:hypothetical protein
LILTDKKFRIAHKHDFACLFCGARPGNDGLEIDHLIPKSMGGSDHELNLICSCKKCNRGKSNGIYMPKSMIEGVDDEGWFIHKSWGIWAIKFNVEHVVVEGSIWSGNINVAAFGYWIGIDDWHDEDWVNHISEKTWGKPHDLNDFISCLEYSRLLAAK